LFLGPISDVGFGPDGLFALGLRTNVLFSVSPRRSIRRLNAGSRRKSFLGNTCVRHHESELRDSGFRPKRHHRISRRQWSVPGSSIKEFRRLILFSFQHRLRRARVSGWCYPRNRPNSLSLLLATASGGSWLFTFQKRPLGREAELCESHIGDRRQGRRITEGFGRSLPSTRIISIWLF